MPVGQTDPASSTDTAPSRRDSGTSDRAVMSASDPAAVTRPASGGTIWPVRRLTSSSACVTKTIGSVSAVFRRAGLGRICGSEGY